MKKEIEINPLIQTKLHRPQLARDHLHRQNILKRLNQNRHQSLIMVSAPAGYGKSTLISGWLENSNDPSCWVSLDRHDNDLGLLISYIVAAIRGIFPNACSNSKSLIKASHLPPISTLVTSLGNEIEQIKESFILVLDDYHLIQDKGAHKLIATLLDHPSAYMQLVLICRRDPPLPLTSLRGKGRIHEIRTQDLRFSLKESSEFLQRTIGLPIEESVVSILEKKTEGWVTGLQLAALSLRQQEDIKGFIKSLPADNRYVMDYVITEILSRQPAHIQA